VRLLRASIAGEASARGERTHELGKQTRKRINADFEIDNPSTPPASEPEAHRCRDTTAGHAHSLNASSSKRPCSRPRARRPTSASRGVRRTTGVRKALRRQFTWAARRGSTPTKAGRRSGSGFLTRVGRPKTATLATSSMLGGRATRRCGRRHATTRCGVGATTAEKTAHRRRSPRGRSAGRSARRAFLNASASPRRSSSTQGRWTPVYGSTTTA
jgi:hypothetical protein